MQGAPLTPTEKFLGREVGGFDFSLTSRNDRLVQTMGPGAGGARFHKTGTTICGVVFAGGVVLGADTRATEGDTVCDKDCDKIHYIAPNIYCCGAGTSADTENTTLLVSSNLDLLRRQTGTPSRVVTAMTMLKRRLFKYQGHVSAALVLGGVDITGPHLYSVYPHGSTDKLPFVSMGSGSLAAMATLESGFKDDMTEAEAIQLVAAAIRAGIFNDLGSGSNVDLTVIRAGGVGGGGGGGGGGGAAGAAGGGAVAGGGVVTVSQHRSFQRLNEVSDVRAGHVRPPARVIPRGATKVIKETFIPHGTL